MLVYFRAAKTGVRKLVVKDLSITSVLVSDAVGAELIGVSRSSFWNRVHDGTLPQPIRLGGMTRWRRDEILAAIDRLSAARDAELKQREAAKKPRGRVTA